MKSIQEIILEGTSGKIRKIDMLTIMIVFQMWKEYDLYDEFFEKLSDEELEKYKELDISLDELYNNNSIVKWWRCAALIICFTSSFLKQLLCMTLSPTKTTAPLVQTIPSGVIKSNNPLPLIE